MPIRLRIALFGAVVVAITVVVFGVLVYFLAQRNLLSSQDALLTRRITQGGTFAGRIGGGGATGGIPGGPQRVDLPVDLRTSSDTFIEALSPTGSAIISSGEIDGHAPAIPSKTLEGVPTDASLLTTVSVADNVPVRVAIHRLNPGDPTGAAYVLVGQPLGPVATQLGQLRLALILAAVLSMLGALAASWVVAGRALRPVDRIAETAEEIGRTRDLSRRMPESKTNDEVSRLSHRFNEMLTQLQDAYGRLEDSLAAQKQFVADASHELRTPLTTITSNVGLLLKQPNVRPGDRQDALEDIAAEGDRMTRLVQELLTLARADAGQHLELAPVDLSAIAADVCRQARKLHPSRPISCDAPPRIGVSGNEDALRQLMWILVDNAVRHAKGQVEVELAEADGVARLLVRDDGDGIPDGANELIFERFYRPDEARAGEGAGLGLAIARWIASEHRGTVTAENNEERGATFTVTVPALDLGEQPVAAAS